MTSGHTLRRLAVGALAALLIALAALWLVFAPPGLLGKADALGYAVCHRIEDHSFTIAGRPMPLCARCTGLYLGALTGLVYQLRSRRAGKLPPGRLMAIFGLGLAAFALDGTNSFFHTLTGQQGLYEPSNTLRLITGMGLGLGIAAVLYPILIETLFERYEQRPPFPSLTSLIPLFTAAAAVVLLMLVDLQPLRYLFALLSAAAVPLVLGLSFALLWVIFLRQEGSYLRWQQAAVPLLAGFASAAVLIGLIDWARFSLTGVWSGLPL